MDAAYAVAAGAAKIISDNGAGLISDQGGGLIANNSGSLIANNSGNLVGHDPAQITSHLGAALTGVTAAVVGVILNLAAWFGLHVLFRATESTRLLGLHLDLPVPSSLDPQAALLAAIAALALFRFRLGVTPTLGLCALGGVALRLALR